MTHLLPCRHIIYYRKETNCDRLLPKSIIHPRWLLKNYRKLKSKVTLVEDVEEAFEIRDIKTTSTTRTKSQNEKFRELQVIGKQIAEIGCQWGTTPHTTLAASMVHVLEAVKAGNCPLLRQPESERPRSTSPSLPQPHTGSQASAVLHPERAPTNWTFEWISVDDNHDMQLSPTGAALLSFMEGVDVDNSLHPTQLAQDSLVANSQNGVQSQTVIPSLNVHESPTGKTHFERREGNEVLDERETKKPKVTVWEKRNKPQPQRSA
ncbi:hypothetical protein F443_13890 [Phytophthora nicotianae P1569]|uniref:Uncharacterized protein n=1 Tax=Phytophthora nicotianae P1569 TaxID=1317065 RepID=V9ENL0_PHYNI|nr:hypothetical protein F443_13890 [Phytophthora nicotianae P1569]